MQGVWQVLQDVASVTRHVSELQVETREIRQELRGLREELQGKLHAMDIEIATLKAAQATSRETIRAEIAEVVAELRVRYSENEAQRRVPSLQEGEVRSRERVRYIGKGGTL